MTIEINGRVIKPGQVFARQGDMYIKYLGPADKGSEVSEYKLVKRNKFTLAWGEVAGHAHNLYPACVGTMDVDQNGSLTWLQQASQTAPNYLQDFALGQNIQVNEELEFQTSPAGAVIYHEVDGKPTEDDDLHAPIKIPGNIRVSAFRQRQSDIRRRERFAYD